MHEYKIKKAVLEKEKQDSFENKSPSEWDIGTVDGAEVDPESIKNNEFLAKNLMFPEVKFFNFFNNFRQQKKWRFQSME